MLKRLNHPVVLLLLGLGLGLGAGAWAMRLYFDRTLARWDPSERFTARLAQDLGLTAEQRERVGLVLAEQKARMELRRQSWRLDVRTLAREGEDQIARLLTEEQARRFAAQHDAIHARLDKFLWTSEAAPSAVALGGPER